MSSSCLESSLTEACTGDAALHRPAPVPAQSSAFAQAHIAIVDDEPLNVRMIRYQLQKLGYDHLLGISDPLQAVAALAEYRPDVVLMDVVMPGLSGGELLAAMREHPQLCRVPVIVLTASRDRDVRLKILELGVADFLAKPVDEAELSTRLRNVLEAKLYRDRLNRDAEVLEQAVRERTAELEASRREVVMCLARAAEYRDDNTGRHVVRVGRYAAILAAALGLPRDFVEMIELAAQLHDMGKIGIPDAILHKPGKLTDAEMDIMRRHAQYGHSIVQPLAEQATGGAPAAPCPSSPLLSMAARIAMSHHERWDGGGYPLGLSGEAIPLEARITAVADVFDALSTARCYKPAFPLVKCFEIVAAERGKHFDPEIADACLVRADDFESVYHEMADQDATQ